MTAAKLKDSKTSMEGAGFAPQGENGYRWNREASRALQRNQLPWHIHDWSIEVSGQVVQQQNFVATLDKSALLQNIEDLLRENFPAFRAVAMEDDRQTGFWLLIEFLDRALDADQSRLIEDEDKRGDQLPHGLAGLHLTVIEALGQFTIFMTKHFFIGNTPGQIFTEFPKIFNTAVFGKALEEKSNFNSYVCTLSSETLRKELVKEVKIPLALEGAFDGVDGNPPFRHSHFRGTADSGWTVEWSQADELPELVVPPIEILEQKEVARRFQRLDELMLLEDYKGALEQCRVYIERHPHSLYLVRRWAFLTLWAGLPFEQRHLDLMTKYDPTNLLTISLWIRRGLATTEGGVLLENLSKLGNTLGQSVRDFEDMDITSLTLPEMLGDAWNHKDDQRAVACYERVLRARGEIPRILVKLIRLMRDIEDPASEESYMDRLLVCEVPTRTRAAIYYRLAEIKQTSDLGEACSWALKSWQTNRSQVRYALLAADLLIALGRPQDAVHILVETSELLPVDEPAESRFQLEIRIADVWYSNMQRLDLAAERLARARELASDDPGYYDQLLTVVERMNEPELLSEILEQGMHAASKSGDGARRAKFVQALLETAEAIEEPNRAAEIFTLVLTTTLLNVEYCYAIFSREGLNLPFEKIVASMEAMIERLDAREQGEYLLLLGDISQGREGSKALLYYEKAVQMDAMTQTAFDYLDEYYARKGMSTQRYNLLQKKYSLANESEKNLILRELYYFDEGVSNEERDAYALQIFLSDSDDIGPLEERLAAYEHSGEGSAITALVDKAAELSPASPALLPFARHALEIVDALAHEDKFVWATRLLAKLRDLGEDSFELSRLTVHYLWHGPDKSVVRAPLELLISRGEIPSLPPGEMLDSIDDDDLKIDLLLQLADRSTDFEETLAYEREALRLTKDKTGMMGIKLEIQQRLSSKIEFSLSEVNDFIKEVKNSGKDQFIVRVLGQQLRLNNRPEVKERVLDLLPEFLQTSQLNDDDKELIEDVIQALPPHQGMGPRLFWLERFGFNNVLHDAAFAQSVFVDRRHWGSRDSLLTIARNLLRDASSAGGIRETINDFVKNLISEKRDDLLRPYLEDANIAAQLEKSTIRAIASHFAVTQDGAAFLDFWRQLLLKMERREETSEFLAYSRRTFADMGTLDSLVERLMQIMDSPPRDPALPNAVMSEIRFFVADLLIELGRDLRKALRILESLYAQDRQDNRLWGALIIMYQEFRQDSDLYELLHHIMPALKLDPKPLKEYQLSLSGLQKDLAEIGQRLGLVEFSADARTNASDAVPAAAQSEKAGPSGTQFTPPFEDKEEPKTKTKGYSFADDLPDEEKNERASFAEEILTTHSTPREMVEQPIDPEHLMPRGLTPAPLHTTVAEIPGALAASSKLFEEPITPEALTHETVSAVLPAEEQNPFELARSTASVDSKTSFQAELTQEITKDFSPQAWQQASRNFQVMEGLTLALLREPLKDPLEQMMALQVAALLENKASLLDQAKNRIWRKPEEATFEQRWTDRMVREMFHPGIKSPLARLLKTLYPIFMQQFASAMNLAGVSERLRQRPDEILKARKALDWQDEVIQRSGMRSYARFMADNGYHLFHLPAVEDQFQFDFEKRDIYIERTYFMAVPSTHLYHRLNFLTRAVSLDYYPFLHLSASNDIFPFLMKCRRSIEDSQSEAFKRVLGTEKDPLKVMLSQAKDRDYLDQLFREVGTVTPDKINRIVGSFVDQIYRLNLAETLDLVGIVESIGNVDLIGGGASSVPLLNQSPAAKNVLMFAAELRFTKA